MTHQLLSHSTATQQINVTMKASIPGDLYASGWSCSPLNFPARVMLNSGQYNLPLLYIAAGFDAIPGEEQDKNLYSWIPHEIFAIIHSTVVADGLLHRHKLRAAYRYYQAFTAGDLSATDKLALDVDPYCLAWIVALLGNWSVFAGLKCAMPDLSQTVGNYTPFMVAAEMGREDVIEGLIHLHGSGVAIGINNKLSSGETAAMLAFAQWHFKIAKRLHGAGDEINNQEYLASLEAQDIPPGELIIPERAEIIALRAVKNCESKTQHDSAVANLSQLIEASSRLFLEILPKNDVPAETTTTKTQESEEVLHQRGFEVGQVIGLAVICEKLRDEKFHTAARILAPESGDVLFDAAGKLSAAEKHGFLLGVSTQITAAMTRLTKPDVIPQLMAANELTAISWLGEFSQQQITKSLESSRVSNALLCEAKQTNGVQTFGVFAASRNTAVQMQSASATTKFEV